jgi:hypothetical protein
MEQYKIDDEEKLKYFNELLDKDKKVKEEFIKYLKLQEKVKTTYKNEDLNTLSQEYFNIFNDANLELYMPDCNCHGYYDYYEGDISDELLDDIFLEIVKEIDRYIKTNDFYQILFILVAIDKAIDLEPSVDDEYGLIYDYNEILRYYHHALISKYIDNLKNTTLSLDDRKKFLIFLLENNSTSNNLITFEHLLYFLIDSDDIATFIHPHIERFHINIKLHILNLLRKDTTYIEVAKKFYKDDRNIAIKLLRKIHEVSTYEEYEIIAKECFNSNASSFVSEIFEIIKYDKSKKFYLELLKYKVLNHNNLDEYILYKPYLNEIEIENLQAQLCHNCYYEYCIKVLEYEKKYDKILKLAQTNDNISLLSVLTPIKYHYSDECFEIIKNRCNELMESMGRNRNTYNTIANLLIIMKKVEAVQTKMEIYIKTTFLDRKPRLPALKDELTKAGLIK